MNRREASLLLSLTAAVGLARPARAETSEEAVARVNELGGLALEVAQNDERMDVSFRGVDKLEDADLAVLADLGEIAYLRLGDTPIGDDALDHVAPLTSLVKLSLEKTHITDAGLAKLKDLENLEYLNIYGAEVSDAGLEHLAGLKNLKKLYVWQTHVTDEGAEKLREALPDLDIDQGWELPEETGEEDAEEAEESPESN